MLEEIIVSYTEGRVRLRHVLLKNPVLGAEIISMLNSFPGIENIQHKSLTGSLLINYDPEILNEEAITALLAQGEEWLKENTPVKESVSLDKNAQKQSFPTEKPKKILTKDQKRKIFYGGMITSFMTMLVSGGVGSKKTHYVAGSIFAGLTLMHMWRMRKII